MKKIIELLLLIIILAYYSFSNQAFSQIDSKSKLTDTLIYDFDKVDSKPDFTGGEQARIKFLQMNVKYPKIALEEGIQGNVYISFIIEKDGSLSDVKILRGIGGGCDEESLRVIKLMPKWIVGKKNGDLVRVRFNLPLKFTLTNR